MHLKWLGADTSYFLAHQVGVPRFLLPEWHIVGTVQLRQVYPSQPPRWYAWTGKDEAALLGLFETAASAMSALEAAIRGSGLA